jgi:small conductance mechanosensitive channel
MIILGYSSKDMIDYINENLYNLIEYCPKLMVAFTLLIIGHYAIKVFKKLIDRKVRKKDFEPTLSKFLTNILIWVLRVLLFVTFISKLGIETASFVAIIGAAGLAIGLSLQGSLSNFAGGILIILFKPFEVEDIIEAQGVVGKVVDIQIFVTKLIASNNQAVFIPNGALSNGNIINHSAEDKRKADISLAVSYTSDLKKVKEIIFYTLKHNDKVLDDPAPSIDIIALTETAIKLSIRPWANNEDFSQMCSQVLEQVKTQLDIAGIAVKS